MQMIAGCESADFTASRSAQHETTCAVYIKLSQITGYRYYILWFMVNAEKCSLRASQQL